MLGILRWWLFGLSNGRPLTKRTPKVSDNSVGRNSMLQHTDQIPYGNQRFISHCANRQQRVQREIVTGLHLFGIRTQKGRWCHPENNSLVAFIKKFLFHLGVCCTLLCILIDGLQPYRRNCTRTVDFPSVPFLGLFADISTYIVANVI
jgi:hypothetical protein